MKKITLLIALLAAVSSAAFAQTPATDSKTSNDEEVFVVVEQDPQFPGGMEALYKYIASNVKYPDEAKAKNITGKVFVSFVIEKDGSISNVKVVHSPHELLSDEAVRCVLAMPKWVPGKQRGKSVRTQFMLPINFTLDK